MKARMSRLPHILSIAAAAFALQASAQVTLYEREGFEGDAITTHRQISDLGQFGFNDSASSVVVNGNRTERWQVCEDVRFTGRCAVLEPGRYPSLRSMGLNNRITSVQSLARVAIEQPPVAPVPAAVRAVMYQREGLEGRAMVATEDVADLRRSGFNDRVSSMEVFGGPWEMCQDNNFGGRCIVLRPGQYRSLANLGLDNRLSSMRILMRDRGPGSDPAHVVFYPQENFGGRALMTRGESVELNRSVNNSRIASAQLHGGPWELCQGSGFSGNCVVLRQGNYPSLRAMGLPDGFTSARVVGVDRPPQAVAAAGPTFDPRRRNNERLFDAQVTAVRAVVGTPEQRCWIEPEQIPQQRSSSNNLPGALIGAVIGGILGHQVGGGSGRDLATIGGVIAGGAIGNTVGRDGQPVTPARDVERCVDIPGQAQVQFWDVTYDFRGQSHTVQMTTEPGRTIKVNRNGEPRV